MTQRSGTSGFKMFNCEDLDKIHAGALNILKNVGLNIESKEAAEIFQSAGAGIEKRDGVFHVNLDPNLVEDCLAKAPKNITFYGRDPNTDYVVEPGRTGFTAFGQCVNVLDPATAELRPAGKADMARSAILQDALENLRTTARTVAAGDQYPPAQAVHCMDAIVRNTGKHISGGAGNRQNLAMIIQLLEVAAGGPQRFHQRPFYSPSVCPTSPLTLGKDSCEVAISAAGAGLTVVIMIMPLAGGTAPVTLAGTVTQGLAEQLGGLVLLQLARKATPVTLGSATTIMDLKSGLGAMGAPEAGMINAGLAQMAQYFNLPSRVACGVSDAKALDAQIGYEYATNALTAATAGASLIFGGGALESGLTHSPAKLVMDHDNMGYIQKIIEGVTVNDENLALDVIAEVGPGQSFLMHDHTYAGMRTQSQTNVFDRRSREGWYEATGGRGVAEVATEKAMEIIENHQPYPLPAGAAEIMDEMVAEFETRLSRESSK